MSPIRAPRSCTPTTSGTWSSAALTVSNTLADEELGTSVALQSSTIVAGAPGFVGSSGDGDQGAAFVYTEGGSGWTSETQTAKLTAQTPNIAAKLGAAVAISGTTIVAGAPGANVGSNALQGAVYVFIEPGSSWSTENEQAELTASDGAANDALGSSIGMSGSTIAAGAPTGDRNGDTDQGAAYVFVQQGSTTTSVSCSPNPVQSGKATTCTATVGDESGQPVTARRNGQLQHLGHRHLLDQRGMFADLGVLKSESTSTCSVTYTETDDVSPTITAVYDGDATHPGSRGSTPLTVTKPLDTTSTSVSCSNADPQRRDADQLHGERQRRHHRIEHSDRHRQLDRERRRQLQRHELHAVQRQLHGQLHPVDGQRDDGHRHLRR